MTAFGEGDVESLNSLKDISLASIHQDIHEKQNNLSIHPILAAARAADPQNLHRLLKERSVNCESDIPLIYPEDYKYNFEDLLEQDEKGRTALHWAAAIANENISLEIIKILLRSPQVRLTEAVNGTMLEEFEKMDQIVNIKDGNNDIPIVRSIQYKYTKVVGYLLEKNSDLYSSSDSLRIKVFKLICQKMPHLLEETYNNSIELNEDFESFSLSLQTVVGHGSFQLLHKNQKFNSGSGFNGIPTRAIAAYESQIRDSGRFINETKYLMCALSSKHVGDQLLFHPLVKLFLHVKWQKIKWLLYTAFAFQLLGLGLYATAFIMLQSDPALVVSTDIKNNTNSTEESQMEKRNDFSQDAAHYYGGHILWKILLVVTIIVGMKEGWQLHTLGKAYWSLENVVQISFIILYLIQFGCFEAGDIHTGASLSVMGVFLMTVLTIFQFGKTKTFGVEVAAFQKVFYTCASHFPLICVWIVGFGLIFWALFYKGEESSALGLPAIVAAMSTGELEAKELLENFLGGSATLQDFICVLNFLLFIVFVVTLHFNLLIGYAVSDIQELNIGAARQELHNQISTIYTMESFVLAVATVLSQPWLFNSFFILPPGVTLEENKKAVIPFHEIPPELLHKCKEIAYMNLIQKR